MPAGSLKSLISQDAVALLSKEGPIAKSLSRFEERPEQLQMAADVTDAFSKKKIALIEAGTGVGKSLAYLLPAYLFTQKTRKTIVISTHTIPLQEQLFTKDFPILQQVLGQDVQASLVKGMHNYICLRKLDDIYYEKPSFSEDEKEQLDGLLSEHADLQEGTFSELSFLPSKPMKEKLAAERESCTHHRCSFFKECHFFNARKSAEGAQILIVNHHLLLADRIRRHEDPDGEGILPKYSRVIIDEAHHLESVATESLATRCTKGQLIHILGRIFAEKKGGKKAGSFAVLREKVIKAFPKGLDEVAADLVYRMDVEVFSLRRELLDAIYDTFEEVQEALAQFTSSKSKDWKLRLLPEHIQSDIWRTSVQEPIMFLVERLNNFAVAIKLLAEETEGLDRLGLEDRLEGTKADLKASVENIEKVSGNLESFISTVLDPNLVKWIEVQNSANFRNVQLVQASLDVSQILRELLFEQMQTTVLCSATLTTKGEFTYFKERLGLLPLKSRLIEKVYQSPFSYDKQVLLGVPNDLPSPQAPNFLEQAVRYMEDIIKTVDGNAFLLFTSFFMLNYCYDTLQHRLKKKGFILLKQGDESRKKLIERFRVEQRTVLFGTDSFWEGVDVVGDALRAVVIAKLPFPVPSEPIVQARMEAIDKANGSSFMSYFVPQAIVKFKQGFGRLIRHKEDRGCIICLDSRLITKGYGRWFIDSLPNCSKSFGNRDAVLRDVSKLLK